MWEIYDGLIEGIPEEIKVTDYMVGCAAAYVCAGNDMGICETVYNNQIPSNIAGGTGISLKTMASGIKSWNYTEASLGLAAINCWYNSPARLEEIGVRLREVRRNPFNRLKSTVENKKIALIGHIGYLEQTFAQNCQMSVITDKPRDMGDFPGSAFDYILREKDFVFADGKSITKKKLPRLFELSERTVLTGIGVPLNDMLTSGGAMELLGFCVADQSLCKQLIARGAPLPELFQTLSFAEIGRDGT